MDFDSVDVLVGAWHDQLPAVDVSPLEVFSRVSRLAVHLARVRAGVFAEVGIEEWGFDVLAALRRSGPPWQLSPGALQRETLVGSAATTHRIDRLETRGLVTRSPSPDDGRGVLVGLTASGRSVIELALDRLTTAEAELLAGVGGADRESLVSALRQLLVRLERSSGTAPAS